MVCAPLSLSLSELVNVSFILYVLLAPAYSFLTMHLVKRQEDTYGISLDIDRVTKGKTVLGIYQK